MSRPLASNSLEAAVRTHFGLTQAELGRYLGVGERHIGHLEAGRRQASKQQDERLTRLAAWLPPPTGLGPPAPAFTPPPLPPAEGPAVALPEFGPLPAAPLRKRLRQVAAQAAGIRWALHRAGKGAALQQRRQWGLAVLQAAAAPADPAEQAHAARWLGVLAADVAAATPSPAAEAGRALQVVRLLALDLEAAALARLLAAG